MPDQPLRFGKKRLFQWIFPKIPALRPLPRHSTMSRITPLVLLTAISPLIAQDFLSPLVVTASRTEESAQRAAYTMALIDSNFIRDETRRTLPDALLYTPGVLVQKTANGHGSPFIRGFTGRQNLLLVDGVRMNNSTLRGGPVQYWNTVDVLSIDHMELIKSQGSVLYGSDAAGGTLNAFTKFSNFRQRAASQPYVGGSASYEFRTNGQGSHLGRFETEAGVGEKFGVWLGLSAKDFGDIEDSSVGRMKGTGYPEEAVDFRVDCAVTADSTLTFASNYINQDQISRWHRTRNNPGWEHNDHIAAPGQWTANNYDQERSLSYLRYVGDNPDVRAAIKRWNATVSFQQSTDSEYQNRTPAENSLRSSNIDLKTIGLDLTLESVIGPGTLVYGADFYHDEVDSAGYKMKSNGSSYQEVLPVADDSKYDIFGLFAQYIWKPLKPLEITAGARYTYAEASLGRFYNSASTAQQPSQSQDWSSLVGSLRASYTLNSAWNLYGGISQAFRAPNLDDLTGNVAAKSGSASLGSTEVEPEDYLTYEIGIRQTTENASLGFAVFYTDVNDAITPVPLIAKGKDTINTNASNGYVYGAELEGSWRIHPQWTLSGFAAWQDGRTSSPSYLGGPSVDKPMSRLLPLTGYVALRWTHPSTKYWLEGRLLAANKEDRITTADQTSDNQRIPTNGTPGYIVASLHAGWQVNDHLNLTCGVENLTDNDYRNHGSGQNEPGISGIFGMRVIW